MVDLAMHMMDIAQNAVRANATKIDIGFLENNRDATLTFSIRDNGSGMTPETVEKLEDPFFTTRTTRRVGLGVPFLKMSSEQTGGFLKVASSPGWEPGLKRFTEPIIPIAPLGDLAGYLVLLWSPIPVFVSASGTRWTKMNFHLIPGNGPSRGSRNFRKTKWLRL